MYTPIGELEAVNTDNPFHSMNAVERTRPKLSIWASDCRVLDILEPKNESMVGDAIRSGGGIRERSNGRRFCELGLTKKFEEIETMLADSLKRRN